MSAAREVLFSQLTILDASEQQLRFRINGIDAREMDQAFGDRSKQNLSALAFQKDARLDCHKVDRYKRKIFKV
jgi:endonuclease YncB( thermonuclease family)